MLLYDQNLPHRLVLSLADLYPEAEHVRLLGLDRGGDSAVWERAIEGRLAIVSKDRDFYDRCQLAGPPPKVIWLRCGNCTVARLEALLRERRVAIAQFLHDSTAGVLVIQ